MKKRSLLKDRVFGALKGFINEQATSPGVAVDFKICGSNTAYYQFCFPTDVFTNPQLGDMFTLHDTVNSPLEGQPGFIRSMGGPCNAIQNSVLMTAQSYTGPCPECCEINPVWGGINVPAGATYNGMPTNFDPNPTPQGTCWSSFSPDSCNPQQTGGDWCCLPGGGTPCFQISFPTECDWGITYPDQASCQANCGGGGGVINGVRSCCDPSIEYTLAPASLTVFNAQGVMPGQAGVFNFTHAPGSNPPNTGWGCWEFIDNANGPITGYQHAGYGIEPDCAYLQQNFPPGVPGMHRCCERQEERGCMDNGALNYMQCCNGAPPTQCTPTIHDDKCCKWDRAEEGCRDSNAINYMTCCNGDPNCTPGIHNEKCCEYEREPRDCKKCCCKKQLMPMEQIDPGLGDDPTDPGPSEPSEDGCIPGSQIMLSPNTDPCKCPAGTLEIPCKPGAPTVPSLQSEEFKRMHKLANIKYYKI
jgi:hypothetical protein